jgi:uncharacterized protein involved in propanediol utilization
MSAPVIMTGLRARPGVGYGPAHFGELMQGAVARGRILISLPCPLFRSVAEFTPSLGRGVHIRTAGKTKARRAAGIALAELGARWRGGTLAIRSNVPVGRGLGSSTADCVAAVRAVAAAAGTTLAPETIARIVVAAEGAADSTMFPSAVLFLHREGSVLEDLNGQLPAFEVLGFDTRRGGRGVDTLAQPRPQYSARELDQFAALAGLAREAVAAQDVRRAGYAATASARINQRFLPKPRFGDIEQVASETGAAGVAAAHSGTAAGLLYDPADEATAGRIAAASRKLAGMGIEATWRYVTRHG